MSRPLEMKINLSVLEHLGMNLYSTIPAVLSEVVANAWDADASQVEVHLDKTTGQISIQDNGTGMTRDEVIDRFLTVGFRRRTEIGELTKRCERDPMGRKGIGKLSSFSIANVITVYTVSGGEETAFRMDAEEIKQNIESENEDTYWPEELDDWPDDWPDDLESGTRIVLEDLKRRTTNLTHRALRQRLARRFSVIGPKHDFAVEVNGQEITPGDRGYHEHVEYLWTYGDQSEKWRSFQIYRTRGDRITALQRLRSRRPRPAFISQGG